MLVIAIEPATGSPFAATTRVPEGRLTIAQQFIAGITEAQTYPVP